GGDTLELEAGSVQENVERCIEHPVASALWLLLALGDAHRRHVHQAIAILKQAVHEIAIADVGLDQLHAVGFECFGKIGAVAAVEIVDDDDLTDILLEQLIDHPGADQTAPACYQNMTA